MMKYGKFSKLTLLAIFSLALMLCSAAIVTTVLAANQNEEAGGSPAANEEDSSPIRADANPPVLDDYLLISDETLSAAPDGDGTYENPFIIPSNQVFDDILTQIAPESSKVFFYQTTNGVAPIRASNDDFIFAEIVLKCDETVIKDGIYCVKTSYKESGAIYYGFSVPVPSGYKWRRGDFVRFSSPDIEVSSSVEFLLLQPGVNTANIRKNIYLTGDGSVNNPYIIRDEATWDFIFDSNGNQWVYFRVEGLSLANLTAAKPKFTGNCWWIDLRTESGAIIRLGLSVIHTSGMLPAPRDYEAVDLPYGYTVKGSSKIVVVLEGRIEYVPAELRSLTIVYSGSIADVVKDGGDGDSGNGGIGGGGGGGGASPSATISPINVDFDLNSDKDAAITLNRNGLTLKNLKNGAYTLKEGTDYAINGNTVSIKTKYLDTLTKGTQTIVFEMSGGTNPQLTVTVKDTTLEEPDIPLAQQESFTPFIEGFEDNTFRGDSLMTREQFITILYRLRIPLPRVFEDGPSFKDVEPGRWSYDAIEWANDAGIINVDASGNFRPAAQLTRAEMAVMLVRTDGLTELAENTFSDLAEHEQKDDILKAVQAKIFTGYPDGSFRPEGFSTRNEAVTALIRYLLGGEPTAEMWQSLNLSFTDIPSGFWAYKYIALAVNGI